MLELDRSEISSCSIKVVPSHGWALANIINLTTEFSSDHGDSGHFVSGLDIKMYIQVVDCISENLLNWLENVGGPVKNYNEKYMEEDDSASQAIESSDSDNLKSLYIDLLKPVHQQWHLRKLWALAKKSITCGANESLEFFGNFELQNVVFFYYYMIRIFSLFNASVGSLPILNLLSFTPGFLVELWQALEKSIFCGTAHLSPDIKPSKDDNSGCSSEATYNKKQIRGVKETGSKWANVLQKISGKSADMSNANLSSDQTSSSQINEDDYDLWDIETMRRGAHGIAKDLSCMLHLFCATYAHLLLVLDDIEFYEKQVL